MKTKEELETIKKEYENLGSKLNMLSETELVQVTGGGYNPLTPPDFRQPTQVRCKVCHTSYPYASRTNYCGFCGAKDPWCTDLDPEFFNW